MSNIESGGAAAIQEQKKKPFVLLEILNKYSAPIFISLKLLAGHLPLAKLES